ncbi:MAG: glucose-6-phosphate dehydrogenase [Lentisphaerae bacterium]|nr:glucose-6-phosphate dehydrogenase [Lentisphaerota bacterium]
MLVIFGASGDLARRKLFPALYSLHVQQLLPRPFLMLGIGRTQYDDEMFRAEVMKDLDLFVPKAAGEHPQERLCFANSFYYQQLSTNDGADYARLAARMEQLQRDNELPDNVVYYLSTPPALSQQIPVFLAQHNLHREHNGFKRLVIEKPFGSDGVSARALHELLHKHFEERQLYRIDHYLGKETVQNLIVLRFANTLFDTVWDYRHIEYVEITAAESIGVEKRAGYFDSSGIIRDMIQNHLLQVLALAAMDPPQQFDSACVHAETLKVLRGLRPLSATELQNNVIFGQYTASHVRGESVPGYRDEPDVPADSHTETYAAIKLYLNHSRWYNVPFYLRAGKRLPTRVTEIVIHFKRCPHPVLGTLPGALPNQLIIRIQPDEGVLMTFGLKEPGGGFHVKNVSMDFHYKDLAKTAIADAYERLLLDCMSGDATLFASGDAVEACWDFIDPILAWKNSSARLFGYPAGTWGPNEADAMMARDGRTWRYPCKNLAADGDYCEL